MNHLESSFTPESVKRHYGNLANAYKAGENRACKEAYRRAMLRRLGKATRILEIGAGVSPLVTFSPAPFQVACDFSQGMLCAGACGAVRYCAADGTCLPFADESFDAVVSANVLEHTPRPESLLAESARVLAPGGECLLITPNGDVEWLLNILEGLRLKLPEGPHRFLSYRALHSLPPPDLQVIEHRKFLALPIGPAGWVNALDAVFGGGDGRGLFQLLHARKA